MDFGVNATRRGVSKDMRFEEIDRGLVGAIGIVDREEDAVGAEVWSAARKGGSV